MTDVNRIGTFTTNNYEFGLSGRFYIGFKFDHTNDYADPFALVYSIWPIEFGEDIKAWNDGYVTWFSGKYYNPKLSIVNVISDWIKDSFEEKDYRITNWVQ